MALFNNSDNSGSKPANDATTIITEGAKITGEMNLECKLYVDGSVEGRIRTNEQVNIGKNGYVKGEIFTNNVIVYGTVEGAIDALRVEIKAQGHVKGSVTSKEFIIESHGIFEGESYYKNDLKSLQNVQKKPKSVTKKGINP